MDIEEAFNGLIESRPVKVKLMDQADRIRFCRALAVRLIQYANDLEKDN